jgi:HPt (histidine-containing phosphotransfer) domain-containing protein
MLSVAQVPFCLYGFGSHMQLDRKTMDVPNSGELAGVWVLPVALQQLHECGEEALVEELIEIFQTDTASRLEVLRSAVETSDCLVAGTEAHTIKGSALQVGALKVAAVCLQMETVARQGQSANLPVLLRALFGSFNEVCGVLSARRPLPVDGSSYHGQ